ncbi:MAG: chitobiase/beta-hexosaminidase C-terminal domain-containing protein, partial [Lachnospiraceae bacterium]|nr:chitobiase/beta-hexosaminidase C-terminal domain-containing protein [Lachnospiraceae bacterium]
MGKLASKLTKRIMAVALSTAMILSNMTVYASELSGPVQQTEETVENTETDVVELPSTNDETANDETSQDDASQGENSNDETTQDGITQDETTSDGDSEAPDDAETGDESASEGTDEEIPAADDAASEEEVEAEDASNDVDTPTAVADTPPTVWIVGDSTVCDFVGKGQDLTYYYPRYGYGTQIGNYLSIPKENIQNLAASGRSSKSYLVENAADYATLTSGIKAGDVLIIGFGHNDEKLEEARYTNPNGDWKTEGSFAKSLYDNYIKKAQDKNAEVILCTPIVRRGSEAKLTDSQKHITASKDGYEGGNYAQAIRKLGEDAKVPVVDLTTLTTTLYEDLGPEQTKFLHAWGNSKGVPDDTHLNIYGAKKVAWLFAKELKRLNDAAAADNKITLAGYLLNELTEPTKDSDLVVNDKYVEKDYAPPTGNSAYQDYVITGTNGDVHFKGSAFGDLGGAPSTSLQILKTDSDGNMNISVNSNKGKVTATSDGIAMYYYQLPKDAQFTFSAKATVNAIDLSNAQLQQIAFGLMARDDMYIDVNDKSISSDYVVAGSLGTGTNCFYKNSNQLVSGGALKNEIIDAGKSYELKIISTGDGYECTFGTEDPRTSGFDFQLLSIDSQYVYIGMFVARNADVTFNNIYLEVDGQVIADTRKIEYTVTVTSDENGTASTNKSSAAPGETVTLSARPNYGYEFDRWEVISGGITVDADNKFIMPASNVEIKAIFKEKAGKTIEVWDFGGYEETDTAKYTNYITPDKLKPYVKTEATKGQYYGTAPAVFGDLSMYFVANDRLYTTVAELGSYSYGAYAAAQKAYPDGYTAKGAWYGNGSGNANQRYVLIDNVQAGDKIIAYMGSHQTSGCTFTFAGQGAASAQTETVSVETSEFKKFEFVAQYTGTYKIYQSGDTGKIMYHRIMRVPAVTVTGEIDFDDNDIPDGYSVKFVNQTTKGESVATVEEDGTFTVSLAAGYTYKAVLAGAIGYGFTNASANVTTKDAEALTGKSGVLLVVEPKSTYLFSGTIRGFAPDYDLTNLVMTMTPSANSDASEVKLDITKADSKLTFSADLEPEVEYSIVLGGVNDYRVLSPLVVNKDGEGTSFENRTIVVGLKPMYSVVGGFIGLDKGTQVSKLTFTNLADNYSYDATVANGGYSIELRDGDYSVSATVTDYETNTHVAVDGGSISKDLLFVSTAPKAEIDYVSDIYVGYPDKAHNYATVSEAVEACELMKWTDTAQEGGAVKKARTADQRVTIHIAPGTYREQIIVNAPYVSFVNDTDEEVLLTWYYGIGYKYYSAASTGFYNAEDAYDKFNKGIAQRWGVTVFVKNTATAFRAENITFENSFNRYITEEELEDGVELSYTESIRFVRNYGVDVKSKAATERAAAITIQGDQAEFLNCGFYSSQDTLGTLGGHIYFKNCVIEGQTDYICGQGTAVFDACELRWKGYSTGSQGGYIAVSQASATDLGYLFRNCTITANSKLDVKSGYFGRPWSPTAATTFINTKLQNADMIVSEGWTVMSGNKPEDARYHEYNTTTIAGEAVSTTGRTAGTVMTAEEAKAIKVSDYFGASWTPVYYTEEADTVEIQGNVTVTDNADINTPKAGNTLTVHYSLGDNNANDASIIRWYSVEKNADGTEKAGSEKLLKISTAAVNKTYKVEEGLVGKYIKVTVTPQTVSGKSGTAKSCTLEKPIAEGYEDPSNESGITRGDGINIFLAGDSTVKDYSASGMYNGGTPLNEGSWGEFIQSFFNESEVTIQNYAQGGRSSRTFINEGKLDSIAENIQEGDYLFIQFGHNDSSNTYADRYVPVGTKGDDGKYPRTPGTKNSSGIYPDGGSGTFKWFLLQYIEVAKAHNAIPVLVTPVSRMYYNSDGTIKTHHDDNTSSNDAYVVAMKELAEEEHVLLIDGFKLTKDLFEAAWSAWEGDTNKKDTYGKQIMASGDSTHNNKLGGMIEAALIATAIQGKNLDISYAVKAPSKVIGTTTANTEVFSVNDNGILTAYDINSSYTARATYWEGIGQKMFDDIKSTADDLSTKGTEGTLNAPKAAPGSGTVEKGTDVVLTVEGAEEDTYEIIYTTDGTSPKAESNPSAKNYSEEGPIQINENTTIKAYAKATGETPTDGKTLTDSKVVTYVYTLAPSVKAPTASEPSRSEIPVGTVIKLTTVTENAKIRYTMGSDPSDPTIYSPLYDDESGIKVTTAITIKAIAVLEDEKSDVATFTYTVSADTSTEEIAAPEFDKAAGDVSIGDVVKLTAAEGTLIYYTMGNNPADPTTSNADLYDDGIVINRSATIKAIAVKGNSVSAIASRTYTVPTAAAPTASPAPSAEPVPAGTKVTLSSSDGSDAEIWYTVDRTDPRHSDTKAKYQSAIPINDNTTIKAYAKLAGKADSDVVTFTYTIPTADIPVADPAPSEVLIGTTVTLTSEGATIYYTLDGTDPKTNENKKTYESGITIEDDTTIKAYAVK